MLSENVENYREMVRLALSGDDESVVLNGSLKHAQIVIEEAFKTATSTVRILSSELDSTCYDAPEVIIAAKNFLKQEGARLFILVEKPLERVLRNPFLNNLDDEIDNGQVEVRYVPADISSGYPFNFMTVDDTACRFEGNKAVPEAIVLGGKQGGHTTRHLVKLFDGLREMIVGRGGTPVAA